MFTVNATRHSIVFIFGPKKGKVDNLISRFGHEVFMIPPLSFVTSLTWAIHQDVFPSFHADSLSLPCFLPILHPLLLSDINLMTWPCQNIRKAGSEEENISQGNSTPLFVVRPPFFFFPKFWRQKFFPPAYPCKMEIFFFGIRGGMCAS